MGNTYFNNQQIKDIFLNNQRFKKMYLGINVIWDFLTNAFSSFKSRVLADAGTFENDNAINDLTAELLQEASLVITPNGVKTSKLYAIKPDNGSGDLTVTRATTATRINASGIREVVPVNTARIDYSTGKGMILVEPQRTNLVFPSAIATTQTRAVTAKAYILSFYGTGSVVLSGAYTGTLNGLSNNNRVTLTFTPTAGNLTLTVNGSVTDWQLEAGSNATSLIPTTTGAVTRNADFIRKNNIPELIGQTEGSILVDIDLKTNDAASIITIDIGSASNFITIYKNSSNRLQFQIRRDSTSTITLFQSNALSFSRHKILFNYKNGDYSFFIDGVKIGNSSNSTNFPNGQLNSIYMSAPSSYGVINDCYRLVSLWKNKLSDAQAIKLTTL